MFSKLRLNNSESLILWILALVGVCFICHLMKNKLLWWGLNDTLVYGHNNILSSTLPLHLLFNLLFPLPLFLYLLLFYLHSLENSCHIPFTNFLTSMCIQNETNICMHKWEKACNAYLSLSKLLHSEWLFSFLSIMCEFYISWQLNISLYEYCKFSSPIWSFNVYIS